MVFVNHAGLAGRDTFLAAFDLDFGIAVAGINRCRLRQAVDRTRTKTGKPSRAASSSGLSPSQFTPESSTRRVSKASRGRR